MQESQVPAGVLSGRRSLPDGTDVGTVTLKVADLKRSLTFYTQRIGLQVLAQDQRGAVRGPRGMKSN